VYSAKTEESLGESRLYPSAKTSYTHTHKLHIVRYCNFIGYILIYMYIYDVAKQHQFF